MICGPKTVLGSILLYSAREFWQIWIGKLFQGKANLGEIMGDTNLRFCAPVNTPSGLNRPHNVHKDDGFKYRSDGTERSTVLNGRIQADKFEAYIANVSVDTYDLLVVNIDNNIYNPCTEYLMQLPTGYLAASLIGQTHNPHVVQTVQNGFDPQFEL